MKRKYLSKKMKLLIASAATLTIIPLVAVSAVACSKEKSSTKPAITISTQPQNQTIYLSQNENLPTLSVEAKVDDSNTQLTYHWYESDINSTTNGKIIDGATNPTHTIMVSDTQTAGTKYFYAVINVIKNNNVIDSIITNVAAITISDKIPPITIASQPVDQMATIDQTENLPTFSVSVNNIKGAQFSYEWYINTIRIQGANSSSYTVPASDVSSGGRKRYSVKISGTLNGVKLLPVTSNLVNLTVRQKPRVKISSNPVNQEAHVNQTEKLPSFTVVATPIDNVTLTYQWYSNANNSNSGGTLIQGATKSTYQITAADVGSSATTKYYYVMVGGNINGVALTPVSSDVVSLNVKETLPASTF